MICWESRLQAPSSDENGENACDNNTFDKLKVALDGDVIELKAITN